MFFKQTTTNISIDLLKKKNKKKKKMMCQRSDSQKKTHYRSKVGSKKQIFLLTNSVTNVFKLLNRWVKFSFFSDLSIQVLNNLLK